MHVVLKDLMTPSVASIINARPTKSIGLYTQMIGNRLRIDTQPNSKKKDCLILDFTDQNHKLENLISLEAVIPNAQVAIDASNFKTNSNLKNNEQKIKSNKEYKQRV